MVVFAQHNLLKDPPFTNINLISCRNLLIYLQPVLQNKVLEFFNFSLSSGSALFLGSSESTGDMSEYFEVVDLKSKIYRSVGRVRQFSDIYPVPNINDARKREIKGYFNGSRRSRVSDEEQVLER